MTTADKDGKKRRVAIYARVSTGGQSVQNQLRELRRYIQQRDGWVVAPGCAFTDQVSGTKDTRPGLDQLKQAVHRRKVDAVIITKLDRLARSLRQLIELAEDFKEHGVDLVVLDQDVDTTTSAGKALFGMLGVFAEFERDLIVERTKSGLARAKAEGTRSGRPLGRPQISPEIEGRIRELLAKGVGIHRTRKLIMKRLDLKTLGAGTVQRVRDAMRKEPPA